MNGGRCKERTYKTEHDAQVAIAGIWLQINTGSYRPRANKAAPADKWYWHKPCNGWHITGERVGK